MAANPGQQNPRLCRQCQGWDKWNGIEEYGSPLQYSVSFDHLTDNSVNCLVCHYIIYAIQVWEGENRRNWEKSGLGVDILGPFYFDTKIPGPELLHQRLQTSELSCGRSSRVWVQLSIKDLVNETQEPQPHQLGSRPKPPLFTMTPQFMVTYSREDGISERLSSISDGEMQFFNMETMKHWVKTCQEHHGDQCVGKYNLKSRQTPMLMRNFDTDKVNLIIQVICPGDSKSLTPAP